MPDVSARKLQRFIVSQDLSYDLLPNLDDVMPDTGPESCTPEAVLKALKEAGQMKKRAKHEVSIADTVISELPLLGEGATPDEETLAWSKVVDSIRLEWIKKLLAQKRIDRALASDMAKTIGNPDRLRSLPNSVEASSDLERVLISKRYGQYSSNTRKGQKRARELAEKWEVLEGILDDFLIEELKPKLKAYAKRVNKYLPAGDSFKINHTVNSFSVGLERDGVLHRALSGSTETRVLAAMAAALLDTVGDQDWGIIILEDRMWDSSTLAKTMGLLEKCEHQIILMSTIKPRGRKRSEWTYINTGKVSNAAKSQEDSVAGDPEVPTASDEEIPNPIGGNIEDDILDALFG